MFKPTFKVFSLIDMPNAQFYRCLQVSLFRTTVEPNSVKSEALKKIEDLKDDNDLKKYLSKISDEALYAYNVYQIEGEGKKLFSNIDGDKDTIMGLPIKKIKNYLDKF